MRGVIVTPLAAEEDLLWVKPGDIVLCADGGYEAALHLGLKPDRLIGDMDSRLGDSVVNCPVSRYPVMKDETDTVLCIQEGMAMGIDEFVVLGGMGGRLDHTYANIQTMAYGLEQGVTVMLTGQGSTARLLKPGEYRFPYRKGEKVSLFAYSPRVTGVTLRGMLYPLEDGELNTNFPLGISNAVSDIEGTISFQSGRMLALFVPEG